LLLLVDWQDFLLLLGLLLMDWQDLLSWFRHLPPVEPNVKPPIAPLGRQHEQWPLPAPPAAGPAAVVVAAAGGLAGPLAAGFVHIISNRLGN
jgi:hypothetical protein